MAPISAETVVHSGVDRAEDVRQQPHRGLPGAVGGEKGGKCAQQTMQQGSHPLQMEQVRDDQSHRLRN